jgi:PAS domain S-box-containing protein
VVGRTLGRPGSPEAPEDLGALCGLTVGYITGMTAGLTGLDVVCSPFHCRAPCEAQNCTFEIRPAHRAMRAESGERPRSGSARFFLDSMGRGMGDSDISLSALLEHTSDAIILIGADNVIRYWNEGAQRMFQYAPEEVVGRQAGFILPADLVEQDELGWIQESLDKGESVENYVTRRVRRDGTELWVSLTRTPLLDSQGRAVGSTAVIRDITEQRMAERELDRVRVLAMIGELAAKVAHEVKNPLAGIHAAIQVLERGCEAGDPRRDVLNDVMDEIRRLDTTILDLLHFARPVPPRPVPTDLRGFLRGKCESLARQPQIEMHDLAIDIEAGHIVDLDTRLVGQVVDNLVLNAGQAMTQPGVIRISGRVDGERVIVEVRDEGPGIPVDMLEDIFVPFHTTKTRGTGLGLSIARKNVEAHGGALEVRNAESGAVFSFSLPRSSALDLNGIDG